MRSRIAIWRSRSERLWMFGRLLAAFALMWAARGRRARRRALEDFGAAMAPLILFALVWLLVGAPDQPKAWAD